MAMAFLHQMIYNVIIKLQIEVIPMAQVNIRIDDSVKDDAENLFGELGMTLSTAFNIFIRQSLREGGMPFQISTRTDRFYASENIDALHASVKQLREGNTITKTLDELREYES